MKISNDDIKKYLPHREPFLFVDEVIEIDKNNEIIIINFPLHITETK